MHAHMIRTQGPRAEREPQLVQLTDPALHRAIGVGAAAVTTWLTTRNRARR
ncbi:MULTISPECIES: hypothetical protein [Streptomyces violaceusniger group]|uniref:hypothetical protein n=1 Tax=Streptomyces violaceusniger group TaxID=2839105 RepID=UPI001FE66B3C|nr:MULTISPECIES: hypothetical protein [Streptomyces violaceusniger group]